MSGKDDAKAFEDERARLQERIAEFDAEAGRSGDRGAFFEAVYDNAGGNAGEVPWADLKPKEHLLRWLGSNSGEGRTAIDVACGLGDNAEAIAAAGYRTTAFDLSETAAEWAMSRFPGTQIAYRSADLLAPPRQWLGAFDLVNECYTIQSVPPATHGDFARAIAALVKPGGVLLVYARTRGQDSAADGPPWALTPSECSIFGGMGFEPVFSEAFELQRPDRVIPHVFAQWRKVK